VYDLFSGLNRFFFESAIIKLGEG